MKHLMRKEWDSFMAAASVIDYIVELKGGGGRRGCSHCGSISSVAGTPEVLLWADVLWGIPRGEQRKPEANKRTRKGVGKGSRGDGKAQT